MPREKDTHITPDEAGVPDDNVVPARPRGRWLGVGFVDAFLATLLTG
jgi:hypothetical protein